MTLGMEFSDEKLKSLREMSASDNRSLLLEIGRAAAEAQMEEGHLPETFDIETGT
jgi:hypothetical protein